MCVCVRVCVCVRMCVCVCACVRVCVSVCGLPPHKGSSTRVENGSAIMSEEHASDCIAIPTLAPATHSHMYGVKGQDNPTSGGQSARQRHLRFRG